jgi:ABC-2 type transport system permease protein
LTSTTGLDILDGYVYNLHGVTAVDRIKNFIRPIWAIYIKELTIYLQIPFTYLVASIFWLVTGLGFYFILGGTIERSAQINAIATQQIPFDAPYIFLQTFVTNFLAPLCLFFCPLLSMNLWAEERRNGTWELLATAPIYHWQIALSKWLASLTWLGILLLPLIVITAIVVATATPKLNAVLPFLAYGGLFGTMAAILAIGSAISALTKSTVLAALLTFLVVIIWQNIGTLFERWGEPWQTLSKIISPSERGQILSQGVIDLASISAIFSYCFFGLFLTAQILELVRRDS